MCGREAARRGKGAASEKGWREDGGRKGVFRKGGRLSGEGCDLEGEKEGTDNERGGRGEKGQAREGGGDKGRKGGLRREVEKKRVEV